MSAKTEWAPNPPAKVWRCQECGGPGHVIYYYPTGDGHETTFTHYCPDCADDLGIEYERPDEI